MNIVVKNWTGLTGAASDSPATSVPESTENCTFNLSAIDAIRSLNVPNLLGRMLDLYKARAQWLLTQGSKAIDQNDDELLSRAAHELKSSSATLGGEYVATLSKACEQAARQHDLAAAILLWRQVEQEYGRFQAALDQLAPNL